MKFLLMLAEVTLVMIFVTNVHQGQWWIILYYVLGRMVGAVDIAFDVIKQIRKEG
jgi:hypothetical protein